MNLKFIYYFQTLVCFSSGVHSFSSVILAGISMSILHLLFSYWNSPMETTTQFACITTFPPFTVPNLFEFGLQFLPFFIFGHLFLVCTSIPSPKQFPSNSWTHDSWVLPDCLGFSRCNKLFFYANLCFTCCGKHVCACMCVCVCVGTCMLYWWTWKDMIRLSVLSFQFVFQG